MSGGIQVNGGSSPRPLRPSAARPIARESLPMSKPEAIASPAAKAKLRQYLLQAADDCRRLRQFSPQPPGGEREAVNP